MASNPTAQPANPTQIHLKGRGMEVYICNPRTPKAQLHKPKRSNLPQIATEKSKGSLCKWRPDPRTKEADIDEWALGLKGSSLQTQGMALSQMVAFWTQAYVTLIQRLRAFKLITVHNVGIGKLDCRYGLRGLPGHYAPTRSMNVELPCCAWVCFQPMDCLCNKRKWNFKQRIQFEPVK